MKFIREAFVCKKSSIFPPKHPVPSCTKESRDWARASESKEHDWLKHILKYHNYYHSHRKSAEKVTWQITQIGNSADCLSWQWPIRKIKDEWRLILEWFFSFYSSIASMLYLELQELAGEKKGYEQKRSQDWRDEIKRKSESMLVV